MRKGDLRFVVANSLGPSEASRVLASAAVRPVGSNFGTDAFVFISGIQYAMIFALAHHWRKSLADALILISTIDRLPKCNMQTYDRRP
jgi:hypothetical protein